jgi:hypothetical protein
VARLLYKGLTAIFSLLNFLIVAYQKRAKVS